MPLADPLHILVIGTTGALGFGRGDLPLRFLAGTDLATLGVGVDELWGVTPAFALLTMRKTLLRPREPPTGEGAA